MYTHAWLPREAIKKREAKIVELESCGIELLYLPKDGLIPSNAYRRQRRLDSALDGAERDKVVPNPWDKDQGMGINNDQTDDNMVDERSPLPSARNEHDNGKATRMSNYDHGESSRLSFLGLQPFYMFSQYDALA